VLRVNGVLKARATLSLAVQVLDWSVACQMASAVAGSQENVGSVVSTIA
jgi:hypothetical protein